MAPSSGRMHLLAGVGVLQDSDLASNEVGVLMWGGWAVPRSYVWSEFCCLSVYWMCDVGCFLYAL